MAKKLGADVWGVESNPALVKRAIGLVGNERVFDDIGDRSLDDQAGTFTHIVAFDVLEHLSQDRIPALLARMRQLLAINGRIILRFPNGEAPSEE